MSEAPTAIDTRCGHVYRNKQRCKNEGNPCWLPGWTGDEQDPDEPYEYLCGKHMFIAGYCPGCGLFWGGIESFDFSRYQLCDNCASEVEAEEDEDEDGYRFGEDLP